MTIQVEIGYLNLLYDMMMVPSLTCTRYRVFYSSGMNPVLGSSNAKRMENAPARNNYGIFKGKNVPCDLFSGLIGI